MLVIADFTHDPALRAFCLLAQTVRSLTAQEKQMSASQPLAFLLRRLHYTIKPYP